MNDTNNHLSWPASLSDSDEKKLFKAAKTIEDFKASFCTTKHQDEYYKLVDRSNYFHRKYEFLENSVLAYSVIIILQIIGAIYSLITNNNTVGVMLGSAIFVFILALLHIISELKTINNQFNK
tara:strand:+ start:5 stop:373 length:369 start_codon:yes stop_codon:yes gene_type:complete